MKCSIQGRWSGLMMDAEGSRARLEVDLDYGQGGVLRGPVEFVLSGTHGGQTRKGTVEGKLGDADQIELRYEFCGPHGVTHTVFKGRAVDGQYHAEGSMFGCYDVSSDSNGMLSGGVAILWRYRDSNQGKAG